MKQNWQNQARVPVMLILALVSWGCLFRVPQMFLKQQELIVSQYYSLEGPTSICPLGHAFSDCSRRQFFLASSCFWQWLAIPTTLWLLGISLQSPGCLFPLFSYCLPFVKSFVWLQISSSYNTTGAKEFEAYSNDVFTITLTPALISK